MKTFNTFKKSCLIISALFLVFQPRAFSTHLDKTDELTEEEEEVELALSAVNLLSEYKTGIVKSATLAAYLTLASSVFSYSKAKGIARRMRLTSAHINFTEGHTSYKKAMKQFLWRFLGTSILTALSLISHILIPTDVAAATMGEHYLNGLLDMEKTSEFEEFSEDEQRFYIVGDPVFRERLLSIRENIVDSMNKELLRVEEQEQG